MRVPRALAALLFLCTPALGQGAAPKGPNVVTVEASSVDEVGDSARARKSLGFVVEEDGFVVTTYRGLTDPETGRLVDDIRVTVREDDVTFPASVVGVEPTIDLAILKAESDAPLRESAVDRHAPLAKGTELWAPVTLEGPDTKPTLGRIAGENTRECYQESLTSTMFRAEMRIPKEAAGAPVYDAKGRIVGLFTAHEPEAAEGHIEDPSEIHVLPIVLTFNIYESLKSKKSLKSPWTGFSVRALEPDEKARFPTERGHRTGIAIEAIWENSPAEAMEVREGDVLVQFAHNRIRSVADFQKWLYLYGVGANVKLVFVRDGADYLVTDYEIEERPSWARPR